jgi:hypothetical protein
VVYQKGNKMRLIDADAMFKRNEHSIYDTTDSKEMLDYEPTAYDVNKVIKDLMDRKYVKSEWVAKMNAQEYVGYCNGLNDAKAIMKGVTIDE